MQFDYSGDSLLVNDSSGNLLQIHLKKNRFITIAKNITATSVQFQDKNMIYFAAASTQRKVEIYNGQGNKVDSLDGHKTKVTKMSQHFKISIPQGVYLLGVK